MEGEGVPESSRAPEQTDLVALCRALNEQGAQYLVVGGMAVIQQGYLRATEDIDLLLEKSEQNIERVRQALEILPDKAIRELEPGDLEKYTVVRVADDIIVDLMLSTCGISYDEAQPDIEQVDIDGVPIPFATARLLLRMKQTGREKDALDAMFLARKIAKQE